MLWSGLQAVTRAHGKLHTKNQPNPSIHLATPDQHYRQTDAQVAHRLAATLPQSDKNFRKISPALLSRITKVRPLSKLLSALLYYTTVCPKKVSPLTFCNNNRKSAPI